MVKYKIYKLSSPNTDLIYIGSTKQTLAQRFACHKSMYKEYLEGKNIRPCTSIKIFEADDCEIHLIETIKVEDRREALFFEEFWRRVYSSICVNKCAAIRTEDERRELKRVKQKLRTEKRKEARRKYAESHVEEIRAFRNKCDEEQKERRKESKKQYNIAYCKTESGRRSRKRSGKKHYESHREARIAHHTEWGSVSIECLCGNTYTRNHKARHMQTARHLEICPQTILVFVD